MYPETELLFLVNICCNWNRALIYLKCKIWRECFHVQGDFSFKNSYNLFNARVAYFGKTKDWQLRLEMFSGLGSYLCWDNFISYSNTGVLSRCHWWLMLRELSSFISSWLQMFKSGVKMQNGICFFFHICSLYYIFAAPEISCELLWNSSVLNVSCFLGIFTIWEEFGLNLTE